MGGNPWSARARGCRHWGSLFNVFWVIVRSARIAVPYTPMLAVETPAPGGSSMKGMNLSGKPGMVHPMQMPPTFGAPPDAGHPSPLGDIAINHRPPASQLHDALGRAIHVREIALLVVTCPIATVMHRLAKQPRGTQLIVQRNHRSQARNLIEKVEHRLHKVVRLHRTSRNIHHRQARAGAPIPAQVVGETHGARWRFLPWRECRRTWRRFRWQSPPMPWEPGGRSTRSW